MLPGMLNRGGRSDSSSEGKGFHKGMHKKGLFRHFHILSQRGTGGQNIPFPLKASSFILPCQDREPLMRHLDAYIEGTI